jgi:hypothetical protein
MNTSKINVPIHSLKGVLYLVVFFNELPAEYQNIIPEMAKGLPTPNPPITDTIYAHDIVRIFNKLNIAVNFQLTPSHSTNSPYS